MNISRVFLYAYDDEFKIFAAKYFENAVYVTCPIKLVTIFRIGSVLFVKSGIGVVNAAITTSYIILKFHPEAIINIGFAGANSRCFKLLEIYQINECFYNFFDLRFFGYPFGKTENEKTIISPCISSIQDQNSVAMPTAKLLTCATFVTSQTQIHNPIIFENNILLDMEGAAIVDVAVKHNYHKIFIVKIVTDITLDNVENKLFAVVASAKLIASAADKICIIVEKMWNDNRNYD